VILGLDKFVEFLGELGLCLASKRCEGETMAGARGFARCRSLAGLVRSYGKCAIPKRSSISKLKSYIRL